jgi:2'-5' RNA ligase
MRLFVAVDPSPEAIADLTAAARELRIGRRARPDRWHVTVAFLGEVDDGRLPEVRTAVARAAARARAGRLRIAGGGRFGDAILWAGLAGDIDALRDLSASVHVEVGIDGDGRPYRPHLTLARRGSADTPADLHADIAALDCYRGPDWPLDEVRLLRSRFGEPGEHEEYEQLDSWRLPS